MLEFCVKILTNNFKHAPTSGSKNLYKEIGALQKGEALDNKTSLNKMN